MPYNGFVKGGTMSELRAPRLTENRLNDLEVCVADLKDSIEHLDGVLKSKGPMSQATLERLTDKMGSLARGMQWIEGKVAAERNRRD
jgi:uncharacterized coiled-coil protein SlyX